MVFSAKPHFAFLFGVAGACAMMLQSVPQGLAALRHWQSYCPVSLRIWRITVLSALYEHTRIQTYTHIHTYLLAYMHACIHTNIHTNILVRMYILTCTHSHMHTYVHICIHAYMHTSKHPSIHPCMHPYYVVHVYMSTCQTLKKNQPCEQTQLNRKYHVSFAFSPPVYSLFHVFFSPFLSFFFCGESTQSPFLRVRRFQVFFLSLWRASWWRPSVSWLTPPFQARNPKNHVPRFFVAREIHL